MAVNKLNCSLRAETWLHYLLQLSSSFMMRAKCIAYINGTLFIVKSYCKINE